jgi:hypothetical protein
MIGEVWRLRTIVHSEGERKLEEMRTDMRGRYYGR